MKLTGLFLLFFIQTGISQENPYHNPVQTETQLKVQQLIEKKAEYHRLTEGKIDGYRLKIHFGADREKAEEIRDKFSQEFPDYEVDMDYQQPYFVIMVGNYKTNLEAFEVKKKIQSEFPMAFIVKAKISTKTR